MKQPSRIDWFPVLYVAVTFIGIMGPIIFVPYILNNWCKDTPPPPTAGLEISIEDMERIASMFAGEAKRVKDARLDALEERIEKLEEEK